jgi:hypothetical protein
MILLAEDMFTDMATWLHKDSFPGREKLTLTSPSPHILERGWNDWHNRKIFSRGGSDG